MINKLKKLQKNSHSPFSNFKVASIIIDSEGREWSGVNVENPLPSITNCAERTAIFTAISNGVKPKHFKEIYILGGNNDNICPPCGVCRQLLSYVMDPNSKVHQFSFTGKERINTVEELMPFSFDESFL